PLPSDLNGKSALAPLVRAVIAEARSVFKSHRNPARVAWLALLLNRQQHFDLYAHSARRAPLGQRVLQMAGHPREAANRSCRAVPQGAAALPAVGAVLAQSAAQISRRGP